MARGAQRGPVRRPMDPTAGRTLPDSAPALAPAPAAPAPAAATAPVKRATKLADPVRQTLDLERDEYDALHEHVRIAARVARVTSRQLNAQDVLRAMVHRFVTDEAFRDSVMLDDVLNSVSK